jgi:hypothetical protein
VPIAAKGVPAGKINAASAIPDAIGRAGADAAWLYPRERFRLGWGAVKFHRRQRDLLDMGSPDSGVDTMTELTLEEMEAILAKHEIAELAQDLEATMETVVPNPHYEFPSAQWAADGQEAVREHYRRSLPDGAKARIASKKRVHGAGPNTLFREAWISFDTKDGKRHTGQYMAVIEFDPVLKKIKSERQYGDSIFELFLGPHMGPDYGDCPGVTRLNENTPPISPEEMMVEVRRALADPQS